MPGWRPDGLALSTQGPRDLIVLSEMRSGWHETAPLVRLPYAAECPEHGTLTPPGSAAQHQQR